MSLEVDRSFQLLVDDEMLLEHNGPIALDGVYEDADGDDDGGYKDVGYGEVQAPCCGGGCKCSPYPKTSGASSLFVGETCLKDVVYLVKEVPNSSFIECVRWWSEEPCFGSEVLEISLKDGRVMYYGDVPQVEVESWMNWIDSGGSAGRYFNVNIKNKFELLREEAGDE